MKKFVAIVLVWTLVFGGVAAAYKHFLVRPTPPPPEPIPELTLALDSFSGYCIFRSPEFKKKLADQKIDFRWVDDQADYAKRMKTIQSGETPMAVFTIDALISQTPRDGDPPAAIVMLIDETRGADAMVSYRQGVPEVDSLNSPAAKIVLVENSPSETLARVVRSQFNLPNLPKRKKDYLIGAKSVEEVYKKFLATPPKERKAFVLWEPFVTQALQQPGAQLLVDSGDFKGFIVDVLVVQQAYLRQHPERVQAVVRAYLDVLHEQQRSTDGMADLVFADAERVAEKLTRDQAQQVARGIWWKNTVENYAHFGLLNAEQTKGLQPVPEMIKNITAVLDQTKGPDEASPGVSRPDKLIADDMLRQLYHQQPPLYLDVETVRQDPPAPAIPLDRWNKLQRVGSLRVPPIGFNRLKDTLTDEAQERLKDLATLLKRWPRYYLRIEGHTKTLPEDDLEANRKLAEARAESVKQFLVDQQIEGHRMQTVAVPRSQGAEVRFVVLRDR